MNDPIQERIASIKKFNEAKAVESKELLKHEDLISSNQQTQEIVLKSFSLLIDFLENKVTKTVVLNQIESVKTPEVAYVVDALNGLHDTLKTHQNTDLSEITAVMREVAEEAKKIPKELPEQEDQIDYSKQFGAMVDAIQSLEKVVEAQELVAEAPIVNVPETKINVEKPDLKPLQQGFKDVVTAVKKIVIPEYKTDNKEVEKLIKASNVLLKKLLDKPVSSGGGGSGRATPYEDDDGIPKFVVLNPDGSIPVTATIDTTNYTTRIEEDSGDSNITYIGNAVIGSAEASSVWQIKRLDATTGLIKLWRDGNDSFDNAWTTRESGSYS